MTVDDPDKRARTAERIAEVRARFLDGLAERVGALAAIARRCDNDDAAARVAAFDELRLGLHNLAGGAPILGLSSLGQRAAEVEARVLAARKDGRPLSRDTAEDLASDIESLASISN